MALVTLYVRTDGNDANTGLLNTALGAKRTVGGAEAVVVSDDGNDYRIIGTTTGDLSNGGTTTLNATTSTGQLFSVEVDAAVKWDGKTEASADAKAYIGRLDIQGIWTVDGLPIMSSVGADTYVLNCVGGTPRVSNTFIRNAGVGGLVDISGSSTLTLVNFGMSMVGSGSGAYCLSAHDSSTIDAYEGSAVMQNAGFFVTKFNGTVHSNGLIVQNCPAGQDWLDQGGTGTLDGDFNVSNRTNAPGATVVESVTGVFTNSTPGSIDFTLTAGAWNNIVDRSGWSATPNALTDADAAGTSRPESGADPGLVQVPGAVTGQPTSRRFFGEIGRAGTAFRVLERGRTGGFIAQRKAA